MADPLRAKALRYLSAPELPRGWKPFADKLTRYPLVKIWDDLERLGCTDGQLRTVLDAVLKTAFNCKHNDPRGGMRRYAEVAQKVAKQAHDLLSSVEDLENAAIDCLPFYEQVNTDQAWQHLSRPDFAAVERALNDLLAHADGVQWLASREFPNHKWKGKEDARRFCERLDEKFRYHMRVSDSLPEGFLLTHDALSELVAALFDKYLSVATIKGYDLTPRMVGVKPRQ